MERQQVSLPKTEGHPDIVARDPNQDLTYNFVAGNKEMLRLEADGSFYVKGELTATNENVYEAFKEWLTISQKENSIRGYPTEHRLEDFDMVDLSKCNIPTSRERLEQLAMEKQALEKKLANLKQEILLANIDLKLVRSIVNAAADRFHKISPENEDGDGNKKQV